MTLSLAMALALVPSALLTVVAGAVTLSGPPASPATGSLLAVGGTVPGLGPAGDEPAFAALEKAATAAMRTLAGAQESLTRRTGLGIVQGAHGRQCSLVVKSRGEVAIFPPRRLRCRRSGSGKRRYVSISLPSVGHPRHYETKISLNSENGAKTAIDRWRFGSLGSAKVAQFQTASDKLWPGARRDRYRHQRATGLQTGVAVRGRALRP